MGSLLLVRHGQASFGAANYDQLSALGQRQCRRLGEYLVQRGRRFEAVFSGTLARHLQSWQAIAEGMGDGASPGPMHSLAALNEYDSAAMIAVVQAEPIARATTPEQYRHHFRVLCAGLTRWMDGSATPVGMPSHAEFKAGIAAVLDRIRSDYSGDVLLVSSGGPIANAVAQVLNAPAVTAIDLNMRMRNSAVTEFVFTPKRHQLLTFNTLPHLDDPAWEHAVTSM